MPEAGVQLTSVGLGTKVNKPLKITYPALLSDIEKQTQRLGSK
jgi:hypothetical protein